MVTALMGTSFVEYKEFGFGSRDSFLASWLGTLLDEMQRLPVREAWQKSLMEHWQDQSTIDGRVMRLELDELLLNDERRNCILSMAQSALQRCDEKARRQANCLLPFSRGNCVQPHRVQLTTCERYANPQTSYRLKILGERCRLITIVMNPFVRGIGYSI